MNLQEMEWALGQIANAACIHKSHREAAQRAGELLRSFRAALDLPWQTNAADLHSIAQQLDGPTDAQLRAALGPCGK
jgi:hypothetical protein